ncbi:MAG: hypothetical protein A2X36_09285 [Elusimicrobia bacterium GWA2_69_24]|nr:MAG: hypothetical protein A2X36_09285 [Elusimicrobia bacterium GWA2_69_24]
MSRIPNWFGFDFLPFNALAFAGWGALIPGFLPATLVALAWFVLVEALALWVASWFYLFSWEIERNFTCALFLGMAAVGAALWRAIGKTTGMWRAAGLSTFALASAFALAAGIRGDLAEVGRYDENRRVGSELRRWAAPLARGEPDAVVIVEAVDNGWPDILVFSGIADRIRLIPSCDLEWGRSRRWDGSGRVVAAAVSSARREAALQSEFGFLHAVAATRDHRIYIGTGP